MSQGMNKVNEERDHAGELFKLLITLDPEEAKYYGEGAHEVEDMMDGKKKPR